MCGTKSLEKAAKEAQRAAERAREFANLFDQYADSLLSEASEEQAVELRMRGRSKLAEVREAVSDCDDWARVIEWEVETRMFDTRSEISPQ